jgi:hypothetical protein
VSNEERADWREAAWAEEEKQAGEEPVGISGASWIEGGDGGCGDVQGKGK